jgi:hypothetical protein
VQVCEQLLSNILSNPEEPKFRKVTTTNKRLKETVFAHELALRVMDELGFMTADKLEYHNKLEVKDLKPILVDLQVARAEVLRAQMRKK